MHLPQRPSAGLAPTVPILVAGLLFLGSAPRLYAQITNDCPVIADTLLRQLPPTDTTNYDTYNKMWAHSAVEGNAGSWIEGVMRFDLSSCLPAGATVTAASLVIHVTNSTSYPYQFNELLRAFVSTEANWHVWKSGSNWTSPGAMGSGTDYGALLATVTGAATGTKTIALSTSVVQGWAGSSSRSIVVRPTGTPGTNNTPVGIGFWSLNGTTPPKLRVTYNNTGPLTLKALTYNLHYGRYTDDTTNTNGQADFIASTGADVVCVNEVTSQTQFNALLARLGAGWGGYYVQATTSPAAGNGILSRTGVSATAFDEVDLTGAINRNMVKATVTKGGQPFNVFCTHLASSNDSNTSAGQIQSDRFRAWAAGFAEPRVVMGDFNKTSGNTVVSNWVSDGYADGWLATALANRVGYNGNSNTEGRTHRSRIDYILVNPPVGASYTYTQAKVWDNRNLSTPCGDVVVTLCTTCSTGCSSTYVDDANVRPSDHIPFTLTISVQ